jgi:hypothetical protein
MGEYPSWNVIKAGYYYRPGEHGYTANVFEAGRYTREKAESLLVTGEPMRIELAPTPNYPEDLNACAEFEGKLHALDHQKFCLFLHKHIMGTMDNFDVNGTCNLECISRVVKATAAQRCEAFCRMQQPERWQGGQHD